MGGPAARCYRLQFDAACAYIDRLDRLACRNEKTVMLVAAETEIAADLAQYDGTDRRAIGREDANAVHTHVVGDVGAVAVEVVKYAVVGELARRQGRQSLVCRWLGSAKYSGVGDVELFLVRREAEAILYAEIADDTLRLPLFGSSR